jgi:hypothetical protein
MTTTTKIPQTRAERADAVYTMLVKGATEDQVRSLVTGEWKATGEEAALLIVAAHDRFRQAAAIVEDVERGRLVVQLFDLYAKTLRNSDYQRALAVRRELSVALGLAGETKTKTKPKAETQDQADPLADEIAGLEKELGLNS